SYNFCDLFDAGSGMLSAINELTLLVADTATAKSLVENYSPYVASGEINSKVDDQTATIARVLDDFDPGVPVTVSTMDGTTVTAADNSWWFNVRPSNTEPLLRFNAAAPDTATMES